MPRMQPIDQTRRARLEMLINEHGSIAALNEALGLERTDSTLSQIRIQAKHSRTGKPRSMGDDLARRIEERLGRPVGWMDTPTDVPDGLDDPRVAHILSLVARLPEWQLDQVAKIVEAISTTPEQPHASR